MGNIFLNHFRIHDMRARGLCDWRSDIQMQKWTKCQYALSNIARAHKQTVIYSSVAACVFTSIVFIFSYYEETQEIWNNAPSYAFTNHENSAIFTHSLVSRVGNPKVPILCYIITMNASLQPVQISPVVTCYPYVGSRVTDAIFSLVSDRVQANLRTGTSSWGADFTNNQSLSIAHNHIQLWRLLSTAKVPSDMLVFEDDIIVDTQALTLYNKIQSSGVMPVQNYILKMTNRHRMDWLGGSELRFIYEFSVNKKSFALQKCVCQTRQNFFSSAAYVIDRQAARVLLQHHLPLEAHIDIFMQYVGCRFSNFFLLDRDALEFSGRSSTHLISPDNPYRSIAAFKEQIKNFIFTSCY